MSEYILKGNKMTEHWTCIECESLFDDTDGDTDKRMCSKCLNMIEKQKDKKKGNNNE